MTNTTGIKSMSAFASYTFHRPVRLMSALVLTASLAFVAAAGADSMMKETSMKSGEGTMDKTDMQSEKMMKNEAQGMMDDGKTMMNDDKGMMEDKKSMMHDDKGMMDKSMKQ
jgi:hypothetical protein